MAERGSAATAPDATTGDEELLSDGAVVPGADAAASDREVVTTGWVSLVADDPAATVEDVATMVETAGGWVESRSQTAATEDYAASASMTVRLPADRVSETIAALDGTGEVTDVSVDSVDVTSTAQDLDARIAALRTSIDRLTTLMADASTTADLIEAESELTARQADLDSLTAQRDRLSEQVAMSTLTVSVTATPPPSELTPGGFVGGLAAGWSALVTTLDVLVMAAGAVVPWLVPIVLVYVLVRVIRRRRAHIDPAGPDGPPTDPDRPGAPGPSSGEPADEDVTDGGPRNLAGVRQ